MQESSHSFLVAPRGLPPPRIKKSCPGVEVADSGGAPLCCPPSPTVPPVRPLPLLPLPTPLFMSLGKLLGGPRWCEDGGCSGFICTGEDGEGGGCC